MKNKDKQDKLNKEFDKLINKSRSLESRISFIEEALWKKYGFGERGKELLRELIKLKLEKANINPTGEER